MEWPRRHEVQGAARGGDLNQDVEVRQVLEDGASPMEVCAEGELATAGEGEAGSAGVGSVEDLAGPSRQTASLVAEVDEAGASADTSTSTVVVGGEATAADNSAAEEEGSRAPTGDMVGAMEVEGTGTAAETVVGAADEAGGSAPATTGVATADGAAGATSARTSVAAVGGTTDETTGTDVTGDTDSAEVRTVTEGPQLTLSRGAGEVDNSTSADEGVGAAVEAGHGTLAVDVTGDTCGGESNDTVASVADEGANEPVSETGGTSRAASEDGGWWEGRAQAG